MKTEDLVMLILWGFAILFSLVCVILAYTEKNKKTFENSLMVLFVSITPFGACMTILGFMFVVFYCLDKAYNCIFNKVTKNFTE
jgi:uncharacterized membrane protein